MPKYEEKRNPNMPSIHPGMLVRGVVKSLNRSVAEVADAIGIPCDHLEAIMAERQPVTPEVATRLGEAFGNGPGLWIKLQAAYDAWYASR